MRVLVTGGFGFMGSYTVRELIRQGHEVKIFDRVEPQDTSFLPDKGWKLVIGDIGTYANCLTACRDVDVVVHNAAVATISDTIKSPIATNEVNVLGTLNILTAAVRSSVKRFVFSSSAKIYGDVEKYPSAEDDVPRPVTPYALAKFTGEYYCRYFSEHEGIEAVCLRHFSVYGPRQNIKNGYIGNIITSVCNDESPKLPGTADLSRDFTYIDDAVAATVQAASIPGLKYGVFNVGTGRAYGLFEVMSIVNRITGKKIRPEYIPLVPGTAVMTLADISRAEKMLRYKPGVNFEEGLKKTIDWYVSMKGGEKSEVIA